MLKADLVIVEITAFEIFKKNQIKIRKRQESFINNHNNIIIYVYEQRKSLFMTLDLEYIATCDLKLYIQRFHPNRVEFGFKSIHSLPMALQTDTQISTMLIITSSPLGIYFFFTLSNKLMDCLQYGKGYKLF